MLKSFALIIASSMMAFAFLFSGCDKEPEPLPEIDHLRCKIENILWESNLALTGEQHSGVIILNGINTTQDTLRLLIENLEPGSYPIKNTSNIIIYKKGGVTYLPLNSDESELSITVHDVAAKRIEGTFYYTAVDGSGNRLKVKDGKFRTTYP